MPKVEGDCNAIFVANKINPLLATTQASCKIKPEKILTWNSVKISIRRGEQSASDKAEEFQRLCRESSDCLLSEICASRHSPMGWRIKNRKS